MVRLGAYGWLVGRLGHLGLGLLGLGLLGLGVVSAAMAPAEARVTRRGGGTIQSGSVPALDVKNSCLDAQKFSTGDDQNLALKGCMQDEKAAKAELDKRWSQFNAKDKSNCVEQSRFPSPSYVEVLTCLEMSSDAMRNAPRYNGQPVPQIGGPVAPGLGNAPAGASTAGPSLKDKP